MDVRDGLPVHEYRRPSRREAAPALRIDGLVGHAMDVRAADLHGLPRIAHVEAFTCEEGWTVPAVRWRGARLADVIALAEPLPSARYVRVHAGEYVVPVPLDAAQAALLCEEMNGRPLSAAHGAPWRLLVPGGACFTSVKWVDRLEVAAAPGEDKGERIARMRLRSRTSEKREERR
jgi:DMSO/TMAO reductase YedYZ molybdopterin-dependent catalytic subunit